MNTLNDLVKRLPKINTPTLMTLGMAFGADLVVKGLPVDAKVKTLMRVAALAAILVYRQRMPVMQAVLLAAVYITILSFLAQLNTTSYGTHVAATATGPVENTNWTSSGTSHAVTLRGHTYVHEDPVKNGPVEMPVNGPTGYLGHENAPF